MKQLILTAAAAMLLFAAACKKTKEEPVKKYVVVTESSTARWKGFLRNGQFNEGTLQVSCPNIQVANGMVRSGTFKMPLSSLQNLNLPTTDLKEQLIHHLQSPDFFHMLLYPDLTFRISSVEKYSGGNPQAIAGANYTVTGDLTMLGQPQSVAFPARVTMEGKDMRVAALVQVDRSRWGMNYANDPALPEDKHILPGIDIELDILARRN